MKIAIAGAGLTGAYLYRLLSNEGFNDITVFDVKHDTKCGINPCAWGTSLGFEWFLERAGLNPAKYALRDFDRALFDDMDVKINITTINKPRLIKDLLEGAKIQYGQLVNTYDRVIDATGTSRAFLPPIKNDVISPTVQYRMVADYEPVRLQIKLGKIGYAWCFPLSDKCFHVGASSLTTDPAHLLNDFSWIGPRDDISQKRQVICGCKSNIRLTGPRGSLPYVHNNIWGVGEAIGCVAPLAGYGTIPGLRSAWILFSNWKSQAIISPGNYSYGNAGEYQKDILNEFAYLDKEPPILKKMMQGKRIGIFDAWTLKQNSKHVGMDLSIFQALKLLKAWV